MKIELHRLHIGDSDDPEIIASFVLGDWSQTDKGQYCKLHFRDLTYVCRPNMNTWGFDVIVYATQMVDRLSQNTCCVGHESPNPIQQSRSTV